MISTRKLAAMAGVSQSTVSRSLRNHPAISRETREKIAALASENGYNPRLPSTSKKRVRKRKAIALIMTGMSYTNLYLESVFNRVFKEIERSTYLALLAHDKVDMVSYDRVRDLSVSGIVAGFIISSLHFNPRVHEYLTAQKIPHVYLHYFGKDSLEALNIVDTDNYLGGHIAAQHLLALRHRRIKMLTSDSASDALDSHTFHDRTTGFLAAMRSASVAITPEDITLVPDHNFRNAYGYVTANIPHIRNYSAIFAQTDTMAMGCINALQDNGIAVPGDISVMGYDGIEEGVLCRPNVTTVRQPIEELAEETLTRLMNLMENPAQTARRCFIQPTLLLRQSTRHYGDQ